MLIYGIYNKETNELVYIGQTTQLFRKRRDQHYLNARQGKDTAMAAAFRKYGKDYFVFKILESCTTKDQLNLREIELIAKNSPKYNMVAGGSGTKPKGRGHSEITKNRIKARRKEQVMNNNKSFKHLQSGKIFNKLEEAAEELGLQKAHISQVLNGIRKHTNGQSFSYDLSERLTDAVTPKKRMSPIRHNETGNVYATIVEAEKATGCHRTKIRAVLIGERPHAKGQTFSYAD